MVDLDPWDGSLWARVRAFELEPGQPATGSVLADEGFRVTGALVVPPEGSEGIVGSASAPTPGVMGVPTPAYRVTGSVVSAEVLQVNFGSGAEEVGTELQLSVRGDVVYARVSDRVAAVVTPGSVVTVRGTFEHIDDYELDEFPDSRHAWLIEEVQELADGDSLILVRRA